MTFKEVLNEEDLKIWEVDSQSSNLTYVCSTNWYGEVFCTCKDFLMRKANPLPHIGDVDCYCKHLKEVLI